MSARATWPWPRAGTVLLAALALGSVPAGPARAGRVQLVSRTMGEGYMIRVPGPEEQLLSRRRLVQYVNLGVYDLLPPKSPTELRRDERDGQLALVTSLRIRHDFGSFQREATGLASRLIQTQDGRQIDLLFGYLEGRNLVRWLDVRLGRQFEMSGLDWYAFDGGWVRVRTPANFAIETFGGFQVDGSAVFGYPTFELDGTADRPDDRQTAAMIGAALTVVDLPWIDARLAYRRSFATDFMGRNLRDVDGGQGIEGGVDQEIVSATLGLRLAEGKVSPWATARYHLGVARVDDVSAGVGWAMTERHHLRAQYLRTLPVFDLDSVFNVFAAEPFEDARIVYQVRPGPRWTLATRIQGRIFRADPAGDPAGLRRARVSTGWGGGAAATWTSPRTAIRIDGYALAGEGGLRAGGSIDSRTYLWWQRVGLDARAYGSYYAGDVAERDGYGLAVQIGANLRLWDNVRLHVLAEELTSRALRQAFRTLAVLDVDWAFRVRQR